MGFVAQKFSSLHEVLCNPQYIQICTVSNTPIYLSFVHFDILTRIQFIRSYVRLFALIRSLAGWFVGSLVRSFTVIGSFEFNELNKGSFIIDNFAAFKLAFSDCSIQGAQCTLSHFTSPKMCVHSVCTANMQFRMNKNSIKFSSIDEVKSTDLI